MVDPPVPHSNAPASMAAARLLAWWTDVSAHRAWLTIVVVWALVTVPLVFLRGFHSVDGVTATVARSALEDGHWLTPHMFNLRWVERPTLLSWMIAAISIPFGVVTPFTARLPSILAVLAGCILIFEAVRPRASTGAALLGAALFLACPMVVRAYVVAAADVPLAVMLFGAFLLWWNADEAGRVSVLRWICLGVILAAAAMMKGPQPLGYFFLGVGLFLVLTRGLRQIPGLVLAGVIAAVPVGLWYMHVYQPGDQSNWARYMRLAGGVAQINPGWNALIDALEVLPAALLVLPFLLLRGSADAPRRFVLALTCYAFTCTALVLFWPAAVASRYVFPMVLPLCALGGLAYEALRQTRPLVVAGVLSSVLAILLYAAIYANVAAPLMPEQFRSTQINGERLTRLVETAPAPIYRTGLAALNEVVYVPFPIVEVETAEVAALPAPAWLIMPALTPDAAVLGTRPSSRFVEAFGGKTGWRLFRIDATSYAGIPASRTLSFFGASSTGFTTAGTASP